MKKSLFITALLCGFLPTAWAQITIKINNKAVTDGQVIDGATIEKMEVSFAGVKKPASYYLGKVVLLVELLEPDGKTFEDYAIVKEGEAAMNAFMGQENTPFVVYDKNDDDTRDFGKTGRNLAKALEEAKKDASSIKLKTKVSFYFKDKIGYEKYGDAVDLVKSAKFTITGLTADGMIAIPNTPFKISPEDGKTVEYFGGYFSKDYFKLRNPMFDNTSAAFATLFIKRYEYNRIGFSFIDTKGKSQDEAMAAFTKDFGTFMKHMSNIASSSTRKKLPAMTDATIDQWALLVIDDNYAVSSPQFDKEENSNWEKEDVMKPVELGGLKGYKFSSIFRSVDGKTPAKKRPYKRYSTVYVVKHPNNPKQIIAIFNKDEDREATPEKAKAVEEKIDKFLSLLKF